MEKNKHLTAEDRKFIEDSLNHKMTYRKHGGQVVRAREGNVITD